MHLVAIIISTVVERTIVTLFVSIMCHSEQMWNGQLMIIQQNNVIIQQNNVLVTSTTVHNNDCPRQLFPKHNYYYYGKKLINLS